MPFELQATFYGTDQDILWGVVQVLIDPVCLMTCYPDLLRNFIYSQPSWSSLFSAVGLMDAMRFVCSRDLLIAEVGHHASGRMRLHGHRHICMEICTDIRRYRLEVLFYCWLSRVMLNELWNIC